MRTVHDWYAIITRPGPAGWALRESTDQSAEALCETAHKPLPRKRQSGRVLTVRLVGGMHVWTFIPGAAGRDAKPAG
jgi:hypothetical protein